MATLSARAAITNQNAAKDYLKMSRVGIFSGTFDPVHAGHISFALAAAEQAGLDKVYFLPEQQPRRKSGVTHYTHRIAMLRLALRPYQKLDILELPDRQFSVRSSWPRIKKRLAGHDVCMLIGSDMLSLLASSGAVRQWPGYEAFLQEVSLVVGVRDELDKQEADELLAVVQPGGVLVESGYAHVSSSVIRRALMQGKSHPELLASLSGYVRQNWLYASIEPYSS